ncbi:hypothetical protein [Streptomyces sp. NPDC051001]|uniref:hypothetical protein n=1 Tax=Streptomyces sp. NPDC051001 TaxID=3155795 RepID=UPI0034464D44
MRVHGSAVPRGTAYGAIDAVLDAFEGELPGLGEAPDEQVFAVVERVVLALNAVDDAHNGSAFETDEREELCDYIDESLTEHGVDVVALAVFRTVHLHRGG